MKKIFITRRIPDIAAEMLRKNGFEVDVYEKDRIIGERELIKRLKAKQYDGLISLLTDKIGPAAFEAAPALKIAVNYADGYDNIDLGEARKRGIAVANTPGVSSLSVAEHAAALMLSLATRIVEADAFVRKGKYKGWAPMGFLGSDLSGKTVGLIGVGHIGSKAAEIMRNGFGARIIYYDVAQNGEVERNCGAERKQSVDDVLREADFISLHVPLLPSTRHLIDESRLALVKPTAFIVNTSRGAVIDEKALVKALKEKKIAGAGLDVYEFEPRLSPGLAKLPNVVLTPHIASARSSVRNEMARVAAQNVIDFFSEGSTKNRVA